MTSDLRFHQRPTTVNTVKINSQGLGLALEHVATLPAIQGKGWRRTGEGSGRWCGLPLNATCAGWGGPRPRRTGWGRSDAEVDDTPDYGGAIQQPVQQRASNGGASGRTPANV